MEDFAIMLQSIKEKWVGNTECITFKEAGTNQEVPDICWSPRKGICMY